MTNADNIRKMSDEELCDYIWSVFLTGAYCNKTNKDLTVEMPLLDWLKKEKE